jgi:uncharacterized damage-inducible protein DinB
MEIVPETTLAEFIRYNNWANQRMFDACQELDEDQLATTLPGSYGTILNTLRHIIEGEEFYVELLTGHRPQPSFTWEPAPGLAIMKDYAAQVGNALVEALHHIRPTDRVQEEDQGNKFHYQALAVFIQLINHGVEHRTNITTILSAGQLTPPVVDGWGYLSAHLERFDYEAG